MERNDRNDRNKDRNNSSEFTDKIVAINRVSKVVKGGKRFSFSALVVVGDGKGKIGVGTAKGADVTAAVAKATDVAKKSMVSIAIANGTIPHEQQSRVAGARILLKPAAPGTGLIAGGVVRVVLEVAGVRNALSKSLGSNNKINIAYATVAALTEIKPKAEWHTTMTATTTKKSEKAVAKEAK
jgi:small subunit ribosomal protein S5